MEIHTMPVNRRQILKLIAGGAAAGMFSTSISSQAAISPKIKAVAFDAFPIFNPRPIFSLLKKLFPRKGQELGIAWRKSQFEYQWLRALSGQYKDFWKVTEDGLLFAAKKLKIDMNDMQRQQIMDAYLHLKAWPDVLPALKQLKEADIRLIFLSNMTPKMLQMNMHNSGLDDYFEQIISTDMAKTFKPDPRAYQLGVDALKLKKEEIAFAAFAGWDVAGAKWFGYPTVWINRLKLPAENLGVEADSTGKDLKVLTKFVLT